MSMLSADTSVLQGQRCELQQKPHGPQSLRPLQSGPCRQNLPTSVLDDREVGEGGMTEDSQGLCPWGLWCSWV